MYKKFKTRTEIYDNVKKGDIIIYNNPIENETSVLIVFKIEKYEVIKGISIKQSKSVLKNMLQCHARPEYYKVLKCKN